MLNSYQVMQQLAIISKRMTSEYDAPKKEALEYAIRVINEKIESQEPCIFDMGTTCRALTSKQCYGCSFRRSKEEYEEDQRKAVELLEAKGLKVVKVKVDGKEIFHVLSLTDEAPKSYN